MRLLIPSEQIDIQGATLLDPFEPYFPIEVVKINLNQTACITPRQARYIRSVHQPSIFVELLILPYWAARALMTLFF